MNRRLLIAPIALLAGILINLAIAWGTAIWLEDHGSFNFDDFDDVGPPDVVQWWARRAPHGFRRNVQIVGTASPLCGASVVLAFAGLDSSGPPFEAVWRLRVGLPFRSLEGAAWQDEQQRVQYQGAIQFGDAGTIFPLAPLWAGFAANSLFYAATIWLLIAGPFALRGVMRRKRGLCLACAYPMGHSTTCTECGKPLLGDAVA